jgi:predicted unusual protein kinase regulating ubiquinone biosynthesis (AarF/ABC1/UbiB family)
VYFDPIVTLNRYALAMDDKDKQKAIPRSRLSRFSRMARMAGGVAAGMLGEGVRQLSEGNRLKVSDLILTPANAQRVANQLATMRGAAMKVGQLLSMETNDILPAELSAILAQLRERAFIMPRAQLDAALTDAFGEHGAAVFDEFDFTPIAAASIGQVHKARTKRGKEIALKVQYPGVAESIDSDVDNIASLLRISKLLPKHMEIGALLEDAKKQLHEEANYHKEAAHLSSFYSALSGSESFVVPRYYPDYSSEKVLAMDYVSGQPIEELLELNLEERDQLVSNLFELMLRELFEFRLMQTDPNFGNYRYQPESKKIVLLDFGATRRFKANFVVDYKRLLRAVRANDANAIVAAADLLGYKASSASPEYQHLLVDIFTIALEPFAYRGAYDFANAKISERLRQMSEGAYAQKEFWQTPPTDILYLHRKLGGMYLLATKLEARVNCHQLASPWLQRLR